MTDIKERLEVWTRTIDYDKTVHTNLLTPKEAVDATFDEICLEKAEILRKVDKFVSETCERLNALAITFEPSVIADLRVKGVAAMLIPPDWIAVPSCTSGDLYRVPELQEDSELFRKTERSQRERASQLLTEYLAKFDADRGIWNPLVEAVARIDCLCGLAKVSSSLGEPFCRPSFIEGRTGILEFEQLRYLPVAPRLEGFIANDIRLGGARPNIALLTGANSSGKSSIMRTTCLAVIMAQVGCYVPSRLARISPLDCILTRMGATDSILNSTFELEMRESREMLA